MNDVPIRPAGTVILVRDGDDGLETLLLRRASTLAFHGGAWVFPGGRLDVADYEGEVIPEDPADPRHEPAARRAAAREAFEEAAVLVEAADLIPFSHWITPTGRPRRFSTWFYLAEGRSSIVATDGEEITAHQWIGPRAALLGHEAGEIELPRPTYFSLQRLSACTSSADAVREAHEGEYTMIRPQD